MLLVIVIVVEFVQNIPKLPNFVKICPKIINLRNFEIPPKVEILIIFKKKILYIEDTLKHVFTIWIFNTKFFVCLFHCQKTAFVCEFKNTPLWKIVFSQCSTLPMGMRFYRHIPNSPRDKNKMLHNPCLLEKVVSWAFKTLLSPFV
jgi:hypothetical protein